MNTLAAIAEIQGLTLPELRARWKVLYGTDAPGYSKAYLIRRLAYRIQELAHGGLSDATRAQLRAIAAKDCPVANFSRSSAVGRTMAPLWPAQCSSGNGMVSAMRCEQ